MTTDCGEQRTQITMMMFIARYGTGTVQYRYRSSFKKRNVAPIELQMIFYYGTVTRNGAETYHSRRPSHALWLSVTHLSFVLLQRIPQITESAAFEPIIIVLVGRIQRICFTGTGTDVPYVQCVYPSAGWHTPDLYQYRYCTYRTTCRYVEDMRVPQRRMQTGPRFLY